MSEYWKHQLSKIIDYMTRQKRPGVLMMVTGATLAAGPKLLSFVFKGTFHGESLSISTAEGNVVSDYIVPIIGGILVLAGLVFLSIGEYQSIKQNSRKRILLITGNGLRTTTGTGLDKVVRTVLKGLIQPRDIDITQRIRDGVVIEPESTFNRQILPEKDIITQILCKGEPDLTQVAYGGFLPVHLPSSSEMFWMIKGMSPYSTGTAKMRNGSISLQIILMMVKALYMKPSSNRLRTR